VRCGACVRSGGLLTNDILELESEIADFASRSNVSKGWRDEILDQLAVIEAKAKHLHDGAATEMRKANTIIAETET
jgi:hypothetical protein